MAGAGALWMLVCTMPSSAPLTAPGSPAVIRVAANNLRSSNRLSDAVSRRLADLNATLLILLECTPWNVDLQQLGRLGYRSLIADPRAGTHGTCVLLRDRRMAVASLVPGPISGPCPIPGATIRLRMGSGWLSILAVHVPPPVGACAEMTEATLLWAGARIDRGRLLQDIGTARAGDPAVVVGDLNSVSWSSGVRGLRASGLTDAYRSTTLRLGPTWAPRPWLPSMARIDYVLVPASIQPVGAWTLRVPGSDHRAVVVDLIPAQGSE